MAFKICFIRYSKYNFDIFNLVDDNFVFDFLRILEFCIFHFTDTTTELFFLPSKMLTTTLWVVAQVKDSILTFLGILPALEILSTF